MSFKIIDHKGFHITFPNGYTVSVQFGPGNYSDHYDECDYEAPRTSKKGWSSTLAETAVWGPSGGMIALEEDADTVQGYRDAEQVLALLNWAASQPRVEVTP